MDRFTVELKSVEGALLVELLRTEDGNIAIERIDPAAVKFSRRGLATGQGFYELAPYLFAENATSVSAAPGAPSEYPLGTSGHPWRIQVSPLATDKLTLPAGAFDAVRVEVVGERLQTSFAGLAGGLWNTMEVTRFKFTAWYAPQAQRYVMSRHQQWNPSGALTTDELIELERYRR